MKSSRRNMGFTMMEMLIAVAMLVILMGLGFVAVQNHQKTLKQLELDETAREIYIAAQNHLTVAKSQGVLDRRDVANKSGSIPSSGGPIHYYFVNEGNMFDVGEVLNDMLPRFSIDDTVRLNGHYVIEYDLDSATIINVFYSDNSNLSYSNGFTYDSDYEQLFVNEGGYTGAEKQSKRLNYNSTGKIIGWYGGDDIKGVKAAKLYAPKVELINGERLEVKVSIPLAFVRKMLSYSGANPQLQVYIMAKADTDRKQVIDSTQESPYTELLSSFSATSQLAKDETTGALLLPATLTKTYVLDDVSEVNKHFYNQWTKNKNDDEVIYPGEDIQVQASIQSISVLSSGMADSNQTWGNSLFEKLESGVAEIKYVRHLENLDPNISGIVPITEDSEGIDISKIKQVADLSWPAFKKEISPTSPDNVSVSYVSAPPENPTGKTAEGTYAPVNPTAQGAPNSYLTSYDGQKHSITGITIQQDGEYAGVFGKITAAPGGSRISIKDLSIVNIDIKDGSEGKSPVAAGGLAGMLDGADVSGIVVYNDVEKLTGGATDDSGIGIRASEAAGGLVGYTIGANIDGCAAAVYVNAKGSSGIVSGPSNAGGLIGLATRSAEITNSYAGGHTENGAYDTENYNITASVSDSTKLSYAGGLIGTLAGPSVFNCYATTSASANDAAGGLIGYGESGSINNCYATGLVSGTAYSGALVGRTERVTYGIDEENSYLSIVNNEMPAIGNKESNIAGITAMDKDTETYIDAVGNLTAAKPYDKLLKDEFKSMYPYKTIVELKPGTREGLAATICTTHYGDWPAVETFVVNQKSSS